MITIADIKRQNPNAILLHSKTIFDVFNPEEDKINEKDIAHALAKICRFMGHCSQFYSVAQHSERCSHFGNSPQECLELLMHDSSEFAMFDLASPIKHNLPEYMKLEDNLTKVIFKRFDLRYPFVPKIKEVDSALLEQEFNYFFNGVGEPIKCWSPEKAKREFLKRFYELEQQIKQQKQNAEN